MRLALIALTAALALCVHSTSAQYGNNGAQSLPGVGFGDITGGIPADSYSHRAGSNVNPATSVDINGGVVSGYNRPPLPALRDATSEGECSFDQSQWKVEVQCAIANAVMFERKTGGTCEECLQACQDAQDPTSPWICRAATFDHRWSICDMFAVVGSDKPYFLTEFPGRDYFRYLGGPAGTDILTGGSGYAAAGVGLPSFGANNGDGLPRLPSEFRVQPQPPLTPLEPGTGISVPRSPDLCQAKRGTVARYLVWPDAGRTDPGPITQLTLVGDPAGCQSACDRNEHFTCASATLTGSGCELTNTKANAKLVDDLIELPGGQYMEKVCMPAALASGTARVWPVIPNFILVGHVQEVADANSLEKCQLACLEADNEFGFTCKSGMWYPGDADQNCLLNSETRDTQADVFVREDAGVHMMYFDLVRTQNPARNNVKKRRQLRDDPISSSYQRSNNWTKWSYCTAQGFRHRYLKCAEKDIRKCAKESARCSIRPPDIAESTAVSDCVAVIDSRGRKRCPHGMRLLISGDTQYCTNPVDC